MVSMDFKITKLDNDEEEKRMPAIHLVLLYIVGAGHSRKEGSFKVATKKPLACVC